MIDWPLSVTFGLTIMSRSITPFVTDFLRAGERIMICDTVPIIRNVPLRFIHRLFVLKILNLRTASPVSIYLLEHSREISLTRLEVVDVFRRNLSYLQQTNRVIVLDESTALSRIYIR